MSPTFSHSSPLGEGGNGGTGEGGRGAKLQFLSCRNTVLGGMLVHCSIPLGICQVALAVHSLNMQWIEIIWE